MAPKPRSEQHKTALYYAREAEFRHSEVRILPPQPASLVSQVNCEKVREMPGVSRHSPAVDAVSVSQNCTRMGHSRRLSQAAIFGVSFFNGSGL
jgi:hypothetical protein